jgi:predicted RNA binding protein YcfA (HicA-like mRNA interferase family)
MKALSGKELVKLLEQRGWELRRINGSHHIFVRVGSEVRLSVPVHGNRSLKGGLLRHLLKMAGISEEEI